MSQQTTLNYKQIKSELAWLIKHPEFEERPATIRQFLGSGYLEIEDGVRDSIKRELDAIFGTEVSPDRLARFERAMITGGIGIGKTTIASIVLPYMAHWVLCLKNPQEFFGLLPGARIAFMQMSTSGSQAKEVVFGDIKARINFSPWFQQKYPYDKNFKNQLRFPKDIWILPGDSAETSFEGYNILGGILDEADSHKVTKEKDYAEQGYTTIQSRIESRFGKRGFLLVIGQMKRANGFAAKKYDEFSKDPEAYAVRMTIWESFGWDRFLRDDGTHDSFWYDPKRFEIIPRDVGELLRNERTDLIEVPNTYLQSFRNNPGKALRDLAGIPPSSSAPFIPLTYKVDECRQRWIERHGLDEPVVFDTTPPTFQPWFRATNDRLKRVCHIDVAYSPNGDALGFAMGHVPEMIETPDGEWAPYIAIDCMVRWHAPMGREIQLSDVRRMVYMLKDDLKFRIVLITMDGFESTDMRQQFERRRIGTDKVSVDRSSAPYEDLREAIYEGRIEWPPYVVRLRPDDVSTTAILEKELIELIDNGQKVDHPPEGSKDVADAVAGVCYNLMGDRSYHHKKHKLTLDSIVGTTSAQPDNGRMAVPAFPTQDLRAPVPPSNQVPVWQPPKRS